MNLVESIRLHIASFLCLILFVPITSTAATYKAFQAKGRNIVTFNGHFEMGETERFKAFLNTHPDVQIILFQSNGGFLKEAIKIGKIIRHRSLNTAVETYCNSSCFVALMAGENRYVFEGAHVGVHRPFFERKEKVIADKIQSHTYENLLYYFSSIFHSEHQSRKIVNLMYDTPSNSMYQITQNEPGLSLQYYPQSAL